MALTNNEKVLRGFDQLLEGLRPWVDMRMSAQAPAGKDWIEWITAEDAAKFGTSKTYSRDDVRFLVRMITERWKVFEKDLSRPQSALASELRETANTLHHGQLVRAAVPGKGDTLHVLHREPRSAVGQRVGVEQPCDRGMIQLREEPLLAEEPFVPRRRDPRVAEHLDRRHAAEIVAHGQIDHAHSALPQHAGRAVRSERLRWNGGEAIVQHRVREGGPAAVEEGIGRGVGLEQAEHLLDQRAIAAPGLLEERAPFARRAGQGVVKEVLNPDPPQAVHLRLRAW
jgi:hypothetical protein